MVREKRFETVHEEKTFGKVVEVICDRETGVCHLYKVGRYR
ncbi:DUF6440 family protein [Deinococcus sp. Leaf326]